MPVYFAYSTAAGSPAARPVTRWWDAADATEAALTPLAPDEAGPVQDAAFEGWVTGADDPWGWSYTWDPGAQTAARTALSDLPERQAAVLRQIEQAVAARRWTQELRADITPASRQANAAYLAALEAMPQHASWATAPESVPWPADPGVVAAGFDTGRQLRGLRSGSNFIPNARFNLDTKGWVLFGSGAPFAETSIKRRSPGSTWAGSDFFTGALEQLGNAQGASVQMAGRAFTKNGAMTNLVVPVKPGDWIEFSAQLAILNCTVALSLVWRDAAGAIIPPNTMTGHIGQNTGGPVHQDGNPEDWPRYWVRGPAPAGAAYASAALDKTPTILPATGSWVFIHRPMLTYSYEAAVEPAAYAEPAPPFTEREALVTGAISDPWTIASATPRTHQDGTTLTVLTLALGATAETDCIMRTVSFEARNGANAAPIIRAQRRTRTAGVWSVWSTEQSWLDTNLTGSWARYDGGAVFGGGHEATEIRLLLTGSGSNTSLEVLRNCRINAQRVVV
ncbi:hypothetical protein [Rubellimicrobium sp. CFH 75288]|uniref:hypothetical protein n=1 Tax=Rubellimicrobium sp. CFH 75288 TaxID=2697034 RepID=UPI0014123B88|nr:hypothetical protein [Rubellimicrobium sp. CFH 75288]NAZ37136.1 hypothetical protein [Rubellimicrobium sp. CFH 75288]